MKIKEMTVEEMIKDLKKIEGKKSWDSLLRKCFSEMDRREDLIEDLYEKEAEKQHEEGYKLSEYEDAFFNNPEIQLKHINRQLDRLSKEKEKLLSNK